MKKLFKYFLIDTLLLTVFLLQLNAQKLSFENYSTKHGLVNNDVQCLFQDSQGYIWIGTAEGLSRFDGFEFDNYFFESDSFLLPVTYVNTITEDQTGNIWIGLNYFEGAVRFRLDQQVFQSVKFAEKTENSPPIPSNYINSIVQDSANCFWVGTDQGLYQFANKTFTPVTIGATDSSCYVTEIFKDHHGSLWIATIAGIYRFWDKKRYQFIQFPFKPIHAVNSINGNDKEIWISTDGSGLVQIQYTKNEHKIINIYSEKDGLPSNSIHDVLLIDANNLWIATWEGLCRFDLKKEKVVIYTIQNGLPSNQITDLMQDYEHNVWIGTTNGICRLGKEYFINYDNTDGLPFSHIKRIFVAPDGTLWFLGWTGAFYDKKGRFVEIDDLKDIRVEFIYFNQNNEIWFGTEHGLRVMDEQDQFKELEQFSHLNDDWVFCIHKDSGGALWLGCPFGAVRYQQNKVKYFYGTQERPSVTHIVEDHEGNIWFGTYRDGLYEMPSGYDRNRDWIKTDLPVSNRIRSLYCDDKNNLWIGTRLYGVYQLDIENRELIHFDKSNGLPSNFVLNIYEDKGHHLWFCTKKGVSVYHQKFHHYSTENGLINDAVFDCIQDDNGFMWFATFNGISRYNPAFIENDPEPPFIHIKAFQVFHEDVPVNKSIKLAADRNSIGFEYIGICYTNKSRIRYQYRLKGLRDEWSPDTEHRYVNYSNLAPGKYTFQVRAKKVDGPFNTIPASFGFSIARPYWQQWWFIGLVVLFIIGLAFLFHQYRLRHLLQIERMRSEIATDLHDEIGTTLSSIALFGEMTRREIQHVSSGATKKINEIVDISQNLVSTMRDIVWSIKPENDRLEDIVLYMQQFAAEMLEAREIQFEFDMPEHINNVFVPMDKRHHVFLIFKEAINNMVKHSKCTNSWIKIGYEDKSLLLKINDNGIGFDTSVNKNGNGLKNMQTRADKIKGELEISSRIGSGTEILLVVPL